MADFILATPRSLRRCQNKREYWLFVPEINIVYAHLNPLKEKLLSLSVTSIPDPWTLVATVSVGGLRSIGFDRDSEKLLILSSQGRGLIDCETGEKIARDDTEYYGNEIGLEAQEIGLLSDRTIRMAGLFGGGLPVLTADGWQIECVTLRWPEQMLILVPPNSWLGICGLIKYQLRCGAASPHHT